MAGCGYVDSETHCAPSGGSRVRVQTWNYIPGVCLHRFARYPLPACDRGRTRPASDGIMASDSGQWVGRPRAVIPLSATGSRFQKRRGAGDVAAVTSHALLADEIRARRVLDRRSRRGQGPDHALVRRAQLPGAQFHARPDARSAIAHSSITRVAPSRASPASSRSSAQAYPDATQFDRKSPYYDPKAARDAPRWFNVDVTFVEKMRLIPLAELRAHPELARMRILQRGNRLSITPVDPAEWAFVLKLAKRKP